MSAPYTQRDPQVTSSLTLFLLAGSSGIQQPLHSAAGKKKKKGVKKNKWALLQHSSQGLWRTLEMTFERTFFHKTVEMQLVLLTEGPKRNVIATSKILGASTSERSLNACLWKASAQVSVHHQNQRQASMPGDLEGI